jgi:hypothetical protein
MILRNNNVFFNQNSIIFAHQKINSQMTASRKAIELALLNQYFSGFFTFHRNEIHQRLISQSGRFYLLQILLPPNYPNALPSVYVIQPKQLFSYSGESLNTNSYEFHTVYDPGGRTKLCYMVSSQFSPNVTIYHVILRCRLWVEAYESHLRSGQPLSYFLN